MFEAARLKREERALERAKEERRKARRDTAAAIGAVALAVSYAGLAAYAGIDTTPKGPSREELKTQLCRLEGQLFEAESELRDWEKTQTLNELLGHESSRVDRKVMDCREKVHRLNIEIGAIKNRLYH